MNHVTRQGKRIEVETVETNPRRRRTDRYIGCPLTWMKRVMSIMKTPQQLAVAVWLHRRRAICGNDLFTVPNQELRKELGLTRQVKYRTLRQLEKAGAITLIHDGKHATRVTILW
jgi:DNA-binding MarR family transcriptional regulator